DRRGGRGEGGEQVELLPGGGDQFLVGRHRVHHPQQGFVGGEQGGDPFLIPRQPLGDDPLVAGRELAGEGGEGREVGPRRALFQLHQLVAQGRKARGVRRRCVAPLLQ